MVRTQGVFCVPCTFYILHSHLCLLPTISPPASRTREGFHPDHSSHCLGLFLCYLQIWKLRSIERIWLTAGQGTIGQHLCPNMPPRQGCILVPLMCWAMLRAHVPHCQVLKHTGHVACTEKEASRIWHVTECSFQSVRHSSSCSEGPGHLKMTC